MEICYLWTETHFLWQCAQWRHRDSRGEH